MWCGVCCLVMLGFALALLGRFLVIALVLRWLFFYVAWLFLGTSKGPHREAVWVGLQGAGERAAGACEPLVHVGRRVVRFFALRLARARMVAG